jgi:oligosaccharyltransferase complex subunit beta
VDHFHHDTITAKDQHDVILVSRPGPLRPDVRPVFAGDGVLAFPRSVGHSLGNNNPLLAPIVRASETAYTYNPKDDSGTVEEGFTTGTQLAIVSAIQARNSARFTVLGSAESLEDKWFSAEVKGPDDKKQVATSNRDFAKQLSAWTFKETGVVKVNSIQHYLTDEYGDIIGDVNPAIYRIKNDVVSCYNL